MPGYQVKTETLTLGGQPWHIRSLLDSQQYADAGNVSADIGIPEAGWGLFGQVWPSARVLAQAMQTHPLQGRRVLEVGAGLALASLVMHRRGADVTVSDWHPLTERFLQANLLLNGLGPLPCLSADWSGDNPGLGLFDLIVGSDLLYERQQPAQLAGFIDRHAAPGADILLVDPDRGNRAAFGRAAAERGFTMTMRPALRWLEDGQAYKGRFLHLQRTPEPLPR